MVQAPGSRRGMSVSRLHAWWLALGVTLAMVVFVARVAQLQVAPGERLREHIKPRTTTVREPAIRGDILDRRGRPLAATRVGYRVIIDPTLLDRTQVDRTIVRIAEAMEVPAEEIANRIAWALSENDRREKARQSGSQGADATDGEPRGPIRYLPINRVIGDSQAAAVRELGLRGVSLEKRQVREYPGGEEVASILGKVGFEEMGLMGAERLLEGELQGRPGSIRFVRDARGRPLWLDAGSVNPALAGRDVRLSIDAELQRIAREELQRQVDQMDAAGGRLVMADPNTGEILAMVDIVRDMPGLSPFPWVDVTPGTKKPRAKDPEPARGTRFATIPDDPGRKVHPALGRNRCLEDVYEPGSTFKPFVWATITELERARPDEVFDTHNGRWRVPGIGRPIEDVTKRATMTWSEVLVFSSNIGMIQGALRLTPQELHDCVVRFGFGKPTGVGVPGRPYPGEAAGIVTPLRKWTKYTHTSVPWGHEVAVTPVQMVRAFSVFARRGAQAGTLPRLRLTAARPDETEGVIYRVLPCGVAELTRETLRAVVTNMEQGMKQRREEIPEGGWRYTMFGKSGTAEIPLGTAPPGKRAPSWAKGFYPGQLNSSFIAAGPAEAPRLVVIVVIDDPGPKPDRRLMYGSAAAGPCVRRVMERSLAYLGVAPSPGPQ
jgi:cell division protein FtsI (penicillin-binding protein 3)